MAAPTPCPDRLCPPARAVVRQALAPARKLRAAAEPRHGVRLPRREPGGCSAADAAAPRPPPPPRAAAGEPARSRGSCSLGAPHSRVLPRIPGGNRQTNSPSTDRGVMSIQIDQALEWRGREVVDRDGRKIGTFDEIYLDEDTNEPAWAAIKTGPFGLRRRVVPMAEAQADGDSVRVPFSKDQVKSAP